MSQRILTSWGVFRRGSSIYHVRERIEGGGIGYISKKEQERLTFVETTAQHHRFSGEAQP